MKKIRHTIIPASYLILEKGNEILLLRRFNTGYQDGMYSLIAGHLEAGETFTQTIIREALEEAGIIIAPSNITPVHIMHRKSNKDSEERIDIFFRATQWQGTLSNKEPHKCDDLQWFDYNKLPSNLLPYVQLVLNNTKKGIFYSEYGWE